MTNNISASIEPWLTVQSAERAAEFYIRAFNASEVYHLDVPDGGTVIKLLIGGAQFWISSEGNAEEEILPSLAGNVRLILVCRDPESLFAQAIDAGAKEIFPVGEDHGWRLGRVEDPFGMHWEIGHQL